MAVTGDSVVKALNSVATEGNLPLIPTDTEALASQSNLLNRSDLSGKKLGAVVLCTTAVTGSNGDSATAQPITFQVAMGSLKTDSFLKLKTTP